MSKRKLIFTTTALFACVALAGCSAGGNAPEPSKAVETTPAAAQPTTSPSPSASASPSTGTDVEAITTTPPAENALTEEQIAALPSEDADVYNECMVGEWQLSLDLELEYDEEHAADVCLTEVRIQKNLREVPEDEFKQTIECLDHLQTNRPELFDGREFEEALEDPAVVEACQEYLGL